jgi:hypothetical protein
MTDGLETVDKWAIEVAYHAGRLHLVRGMPWAAMWATKIQSLLWVVFSKYYFYSQIIFVCK